MGLVVAGEATVVHEPADVRSMTQRRGIALKPFWAGSRRATSTSMPDFAVTHPTSATALRAYHHRRRHHPPEQHPQLVSDLPRLRPCHPHPLQRAQIPLPTVPHKIIMKGPLRGRPSQQRPVVRSPVDSAQRKLPGVMPLCGVGQGVRGSPTRERFEGCHSWGSAIECHLEALGQPGEEPVHVVARGELDVWSGRPVQA